MNKEPQMQRVYCVNCKGLYEPFMKESFGEAFECPGCKAVVAINWDKDTIEVETKE